MSLAIETQALTKRYGRVIAVQDLWLNVKPGEIYAFLGLNGAGKTTTIRMLLGMHHPSQGQARLLGQVVRPGERRLWSQVGYLVETPHVYPELSVTENLEAARRLHPGTPPQAVAEVIERLGLGEYASRPAGHLSLGNLQRLGLAKALIHRPSLLILDEPANALDPAGIVEIRRLLLELAHQHGVTVFMSSHILAEAARLADRVGVIHQGRLLQELDWAELVGNRRRRLVIETYQAPAALAALQAAGYDPHLLEEAALDNALSAVPHPAGGPPQRLELTAAEAVAHSDRAAERLALAGCPPRQLIIEEEDLEQYFLRLIKQAGESA